MGGSLNGKAVFISGIILTVGILCLLGGCLGESGSGGAVVNFTPDQEFYRLRLTFHEETTAYSKKSLDEHMRLLQSLEKKTDSRALKIGLRRYIALTLYLKARLESFEKLTDSKAARRLDRITEAQKLLVKLEEADPDSLDNACIRGLTERLLGELTPEDEAATAHRTQALRLFRKVRLTKPDFASSFLIGGRPVTALEVLLLEADVYRSLHRYRVAAAWFERALASDTTLRRNSSYRIPKARLMVEFGRWDEAIKLLNVYKGERYRDDPRWGIALWMLKGIHERLSKINKQEHEVDINIITGLLENSKNMFSEASIGSFSDVILAIPSRGTRLVKALQIMADGRFETARNILQDLLNQPDPAGWFRSEVFLLLDLCLEALKTDTAQRVTLLTSFLEDYPFHPAGLEIKKAIDTATIAKETILNDQMTGESTATLPVPRLPGVPEGDGPFLVWITSNRNSRGLPRITMEVTTGAVTDGPLTVLGVLRGTDVRKMADPMPAGFYRLDMFTAQQLAQAEDMVLDISLASQDTQRTTSFPVPLPPVQKPKKAESD